MRFLKNYRALGSALLLFGSASAFAAAPAITGGVLLPRGVDMPAYMITAADLGNKTFMDCLRTRIKMPGDKNAVFDVQAAISCQSSRD